VEESLSVGSFITFLFLWGLWEWSRRKKKPANMTPILFLVAGIAIAILALGILLLIGYS